jgi:P27 family predicted phage terminase small subunit
MRGRKPTPLNLQLLRGNPGKRPLNMDEPVPPPLSAEPVPAELIDREARDEWTRIAPGLIACGQVTMADRTLLVAYCLKYGQWLRLEAEARKHPMIVKGARGTPLSNPAVRLANQTLDLVIRAAAELGITPTARTRVARTPIQPAVSKWADALSS